MSFVWQQIQVSTSRSAYRLNLFSFVYPGSPAAINGDVIGRYFSYNTASDEHFATIREWIKECQAHPKCNQTVLGSVNIDAQHSLLPTRCIEVSQNGKNVRLGEALTSPGDLWRESKDAGNLHRTSVFEASQIPLKLSRLEWNGVRLSTTISSP
jgi:hypothetical protein